jgi:hypothetical protein
LYPESRIDVEVSSGEDDEPKSDALASKKRASAGDDTEDGECIQPRRSLLTRSVLTR